MIVSSNSSAHLQKCCNSFADFVVASASFVVAVVAVVAALVVAPTIVSA